MKHSLTNLSKASLLMAAATTGLMGTSHAAVIYEEAASDDLSNTIGSPTVLGTGVLDVTGILTDDTDLEDYFLFSDLTANFLATFDYGFTTGPELAIAFTFSDPAGDILATAGPASGSGVNGSTNQVVVPASGQIRVSVVSSQVGTVEGFPTTTWDVGVTETVPETSGAALVALGSLLALRRRRD